MVDGDEMCLRLGESVGPLNLDTFFWRPCHNVWKYLRSLVKMGIVRRHENVTSQQLCPQKSKILGHHLDFALHVQAPLRALLWPVCRWFPCLAL